MLDTNIASVIIKNRSQAARKRLQQVAASQVCISVITEAELLHGVAKKPEATRLPAIINGFLLQVDILPWDSEVARVYGSFRARCETEGLSLSCMDMLIAAHAQAQGATLITNDQAFFKLSAFLNVEDWTQA